MTIRPLQRDRMSAVWITLCAYGPWVCIGIAGLCFWVGGLG